MPYLIATDKPLYWTAQLGANIVISDIAEIGGKIGIPPTMTATSNVDPNAYLGAMVGKGGAYKPLPPVGEQCDAGVIYGYNGDLVICRQSHNRTADLPSTIPALFSVYRAGQDGVILAWVANEKVMVGDQRTYGGKTWNCLMAHVTQIDWTPPQVPALWGEVVAVGAWSGAGVAYKVNDHVTYLGHTYKCLQAHTSQPGWDPVTVPALWQFLS
jgi:chitodextrinase